MPKTEICHVPTTSFRDMLGDYEYPYEDGRYWLFTSKLCPFAHRTEIARAYMGLEHSIGLTIAGPVQTEKGWNLKERTATAESAACPIPGADNLPAIYELASPGYAGRVSVPVLFDMQSKRIVNNESAEIIRMLDTLEAKRADVPSIYEVYTEDERNEIDRICLYLDAEFITPIYQAGFAKDQRHYESNAKRVFAALDNLEICLSNNGPYLAGSAITAADIHAFPHLSRFDAIYHSLYGLNAKYIRDYPAVTTYVDRLARTHGFGSTLDIDASKTGYFKSWNQPTDGAFVPVGPAVNPDTGIALAA